MRIENALKIEGWMDPPELEWLAKQARTHSAIAEVGCWMGRSTLALAENTPGIVYAVDTWRGSEEHQSALVDKPPTWLLQKFYKNLYEYIIRGKVVPIPLPSVEAAEEIRSRFRLYQFDMVFIDAAHDYESVKADILAWKPLVMQGGIICGHDSGYPPVAQAVRETLGTPGEAGVIWVVHV